jgi:hypothetical protein
MYDFDTDNGTNKFSIVKYYQDLPWDYVYLSFCLYGMIRCY